MASQSAGWEIVGGLIGTGASATYGMHGRAQESVDQLLALPLDKALQSLAASVPAMEEDVWVAFSGQLRARAQQSSKAGRLFLFADDVRQIAPHIRRLLYLSSETLIASTFDIVEKLDESTWAVFQLTMAGFTKASDVAASVLGLAASIRRQHVALQRTLACPPEDRLPTLIRHILRSDDSERSIFRSVLAHQAAQHDTILIEVAALTEALLPLTQHLRQGTLDQATLAIIDAAPQLQEIGWSVLKMMLMEDVDASDLIKLIIPTLDRLRQAISYADMIASFPKAMARQRLLEDSLRHLGPDMPWPLIRLVWHRRAESSEFAHMLSGYAEHIHHILPFVAQILDSAPDEARQRLAAAACMDVEGELVIDMLTLEAAGHPSASQRLGELRRLRQARQQIGRLMHAPADQAEEHMRALASRTDAQAWGDLEAVLRFLAEQSTEASGLLRIGAQERGRRGDAEGALRSRVQEALADGIITDEERAEIDALTQQLRLPQDFASSIVAEARALYERQAAAEDAIRSRVRAALADDVLTPDELDDIRRMRDDLHVTAELVEQILEATRQEREAARQTEQASIPAWIAQGLSESPEQTLAQQLREALSDRVITAQEGAALEQLRERLQISTDRAQLLLRQVHQEQLGAAHEA